MSKILDLAGFFSATLGTVGTMVAVGQFPSQVDVSAWAKNVEPIGKEQESQLPSATNWLKMHLKTPTNTKLDSARLSEKPAQQKDRQINEEQETITPEKYLNQEQSFFPLSVPQSLHPRLDLSFLNSQKMPALEQKNGLVVNSTELTEPSAETLQQQEQQLLKLTLADVVALALENNRAIKNAYLQRIIDRQNLAVAKDKFVPNFTPSLSADQEDSTFEQLGFASTATVRLPTGTEIELNSTGIGLSIGDTGLDYQVSLTQPLLRGFGTDINRASVEIAELQEAANILALKSTLTNTVTDAIETYRQLIQSQEQLKIEQLSLESAQRQFEVIEALIAAGRRARVELVQSETDVANREVTVLAAQNNLAQTRLDLLEILDIDRDNIQPVAVEIEEFTESQPLQLESLLKLAVSNNPQYLQSLLRLEIAKLNITLAKNQRRWDLNLRLSYRGNTRDIEDSQTGFRAGVFFSREFGNLTLEQAVERSQVNLERTQNNWQESRESLEIELNQRIRDVQVNLEQIELTRRARELSEKQLENEQEKLRLGVQGTRLIDLLNFEDDLVRAKNRELNAKIDYLNALTRLEQTVGITLERWQINLEEINKEVGE